MNNSALNSTQRWAAIRCWWFCYWHVGKGYMRVKTYEVGSGDLVAISAVDQEHRIAKVFWKAPRSFVAPLP